MDLRAINFSESFCTVSVSLGLFRDETNICRIAIFFVSFISEMKLRYKEREVFSVHQTSTQYLILVINSSSGASV